MQVLAFILQVTVFVSRDLESGVIEEVEL